MTEFTVDAIDGNADNVLGASFNWGETGSFTYHKMGTAVLTLIIPDDDTEIKMALRRKHTPPKNQTPSLTQGDVLP